MFYYENYIEPSFFFNPDENIVPLDLWDQSDYVLKEGKFWLSGEIIVARLMEAKDIGLNPITIRDKCLQLVESSVKIEIVGIK